MDFRKRKPLMFFELEFGMHDNPLLIIYGA